MKMTDYQQQARTTAIYPENYRVLYPALGLAGEAGEVCNKVKKVYRDSGGVVNQQIKDVLAAEISDCLWYCAALASDLGLDLGEIAQANIDKLLSRKERGTLKGDGDNR